MLQYELGLLLGLKYEALLGLECVKDDGVFLVEEDGIEIGLLLSKKEVVLLGLGLGNNDENELVLKLVYYLKTKMEYYLMILMLFK